MIRSQRPRIALLVLMAAGAAVVLAGGSTPLETETLRFQVCEGGREVGQMRLEVMTIKNLAILKETFTAPYRVKGKAFEAGFDSQVVYKGEGRPAISRGDMSTHIGTFKIMEGKVTFGQTEGQWAAEVEATGYADTERQPFENARSWTKTITTTGDLLLTHAAFLHFAPRLLKAPGKIEKVTYVEFPDDIGWPEALNFQTDCVLERHDAGVDGKAEITLHRVFAGGNIVPILKMTLGADGQVVEARLGKFTLRPPAPSSPRVGG